MTIPPAAPRAHAPRPKGAVIALAAGLVLATFGVPLVRAEDLPPAVGAAPPTRVELARLTRDLSSASPGVRARAAREIATLGPSGVEAVPFLVRALTPRSPVVSAGVPSSPDAAAWAAAEALGAIGPGAAPRVIVAMRDPWPQVREAAAYALGRMRPVPDDAVVHLVRALDDGQRSVREMAAQSLGRIGAPAVARVAHALGTGTIVSREAAARALTLVGPVALAPAIPALSRALSTPEAAVRVAVVHALGRAAPESIDAAEALVVALRDRDAAVRAAAAASLGDVGRAEVWTTAAIVNAFADADSGVRTQAAKSVAGRAAFADRIVTPLARLLSDREDLVVMAAASTLARFGPAADGAVVPLLDLLRSEREPLVRAAAADALGGIGSRASAASPALRRIAADRDEDPEVRDSAFLALERIGR